MIKGKKRREFSHKVKLGLMAGLLVLSTVPFTGNSSNMNKALAATGTPGGTPDYWTTPNYANSPLPEINQTTGQVVPGTGIRKFVDSLPGLGVDKKNNLGQYIPVAIPDTTTYPGSDYYEISLVEYSEQLHSDLPKTKLRGYMQTNTDDPTVKNVSNFFGPMIIAHKDRPVRVKFTNKLPTGTGGDLFIPVDTSLMGAGMGPDGQTMYTQNRATLHLHGGITPWISDGTPHQWITPAGEDTSYPKGVSVRNVPDMPDPGNGSMTFFYTNQQSARLMFYHDHSYGITRLNVYAGEAAGYMITDDVEKDLISRRIIPDENSTMPLILEDKTFVPTDNQLLATDPTWDKTKWGGFGQLWFPHVYMPNQNPFVMSGANPMGRWDYGPWFWPPNTGLKNGPAANPLYQEGVHNGQAPMNPGVPNVSTTPEAFMDTPVINGTAYPTLTVEPKAYRFKILNAANDRMWNLQLYKAASNGRMWNKDGTLENGNAGEVKMVPAVATPSFPSTWPTDGRAGGVPDPASAGPEMIQIGNDSGFLPKPAILPNQPVDYEYGRRSITVLNISSKTVLLGPAERADVIVDFSKYAGQTLILYNDAPTPVPAFDPRYDYYTGDPDQSVTGENTGGAPTTQPGYGPNTRTIMQITVSKGKAAPEYDIATLNTELPKAFKSGQNQLIFNNNIYGENDPNNDPLGKWVNIQDNSSTFNVPGTEKTVTMDLTPKAIAEEFEQVYGRMNATLGTELPNTNFQNQTTIMLGYVDPTTENMTDSIAPIGETGDGTQLWKITHNGVDTHAIHFHLFDVQLINRVGWDGSIRMPDDNERGWKDTVRMNPLEDCIVALRPVAPKIPFGIPNSIRPLDPASPLHSTGQFMNVDPLTGDPVTVTNEMTNFGWEYIWHCHLLGHEENDMMRSYHFTYNAVAPSPSVLTAARSADGAVNLTWTDPTEINYSDITTFGKPDNEVGYNVMRATVTDDIAGMYEKVGSVLANNTTFVDKSADPYTNYSYRVDAFNTATDTPNSTDPNSMYNSGTPSNLVEVAGLPFAPTELTATANGIQADLTWKDNAANETGFVVERSNDGVNFIVIDSSFPAATGTGSIVTFSDNTVVMDAQYIYRVKAINGAVESPYSKTATVTFGSPLPLAPGNLTTTLLNGPVVKIGWIDNSIDESGFVVERSSDGGKTYTAIATPAADNGTGEMSYQDKDLTLNTTYLYRVKSIKGAYSSSYSNTSEVTVPNVPAAPTNLTGSSPRGSKTLMITWTPPAGPIIGYALEIATDRRFSRNVVSYTVDGTATSTVLDALRVGTTYYFRLKASNQSGSSPWATSRNGVEIR